MNDYDYVGYNYTLHHYILESDDGEPEVHLVPKRHYKQEMRVSHVDSSSYAPSDDSSTDLVSSLDSFDLEALKVEWWQLYHPYYAFKDPRIRSRLERLMGSNVVRIMDRKYMTKLQERLKEDHIDNLTKRIQEREAEEVEREKKLILEGKIPIEEAPIELKDHPVCKINQITKKILEEKKAKTKNNCKISAYKTNIKKSKDDGDKMKQDTIFESGEDEEKVEEEMEEKIENSDGTEENEPHEPETEPVDEKKEALFGKEEYDKLKYEDPLVKVMKEAGNVEEMYRMAERIVGPLKHTKKSK